MASYVKNGFFSRRHTIPPTTDVTRKKTSEVEFGRGLYTRCHVGTPTVVPAPRGFPRSLFPKIWWSRSIVVRRSPTFLLEPHRNREIEKSHCRATNTTHSALAVAGTRGSIEHPVSDLSAKHGRHTEKPDAIAVGRPLESNKSQLHGSHLALRITVSPSDNSDDTNPRTTRP